MKKIKFKPLPTVILLNIAALVVFAEHAYLHAAYGIPLLELFPAFVLILVLLYFPLISTLRLAGALITSPLQKVAATPLKELDLAAAEDIALAVAANNGERRNALDLAQAVEKYFKYSGWPYVANDLIQILEALQSRMGRNTLPSGLVPRFLFNAEKRLRDSSQPEVSIEKKIIDALEQTDFDAVR